MSKLDQALQDIKDAIDRAEFMEERSVLVNAKTLQAVPSALTRPEQPDDINADGWCRHTSIHTRVNSTVRISSIWREYSNPYFQTWAWETIVWRGDKIAVQVDSMKSINEVMRIHKRLYDEYSKEQEEPDGR